ncbi:hypothetical protein [Lacinutrix venerupis]|uniref:Uncharacterized protein n=1 Tax=Lacinutrix venerupis TaxID=1486034 RepID=A0AAC9LQZ7_9FLAO|nr:hypothetical protein [Lacinutrix venerupis]APY01412.1 hypothetical protein BWR22_14235 [Lacinutrix venerupis]
MGKLTNLKIKRADKIGMVFFFSFVLATTLIWFFEERFNVEQWKTQPRMRYKMADDIIENKILIGKTKQDIILLLGKAQYEITEGKNHFIYSLGKPTSFSELKEAKLIIVFENNIAVKVMQIEE